MLPKTHIIFGAIFSILIYYLFGLGLFETSLIFLASFLIDFDHYLFYVFRKKDINLKKAYFWHKNFPKNRKPIMQIFHTIEFSLFVFLLSFLWKGFLFILIGMLLHSILDLIQMAYDDELQYREFFFTCYLLSNKSDYY